MKYTLTLIGCDGMTAIERDLSDSEALLLKDIAVEFAKESMCSCEPTMRVEAIQEESETGER